MVSIRTVPMQRDQNLVRLSHDHQSGLVLAKRARELATAADPERRAAWAELQTRFADELEPHFQLEERGLPPALRLAGQAALVKRTLNEHAELRALVGLEPRAYWRCSIGSTHPGATWSCNARQDGISHSAPLRCARRCARIRLAAAL